MFETAASEFPNDNPALHHGTVWVCLGTCSAPTPERHEAPALADSGIVARTDIEAETNDPRDDDEIVIEPIEPFEPTETFWSGDERPLTAPSSLPPPPDDAFTVLLCTLADAAIAAGSPEVASMLPGLLVDGRLDPALEDDALAALVDGGIAERDGAEVRARDEFVTTARAWRAVLRNESDDLSACGSQTLDEWAADLVARLLGTSGRASQLRRDLRGRGIAAYGLIEAAS